MGRALIGCCPVATANQSSPHSGPILSEINAIIAEQDIYMVYLYYRVAGLKQNNVRHTITSMQRYTLFAWKDD